MARQQLVIWIEDSTLSDDTEFTVLNDLGAQIGASGYAYIVEEA